MIHQQVGVQLFEKRSEIVSTYRLWAAENVPLISVNREGHLEDLSAH